jgi:diacylglycerol kinase family enzyme
MLPLVINTKTKVLDGGLPTPQIKRVQTTSPHPSSLHLISNAKSGSSSDGASLRDLASRLCSERGVEFHYYEISEGAQFDEQVEKAIAAAKNDFGVIAAAGGDGTIRGVAQKVRGQGTPLAVIPCGTYNYFARTHLIPENAEQALQLALTGTARPVRLGEVNGEVFLINASLGIYSKVIREREERTDRFGRNRMVASISTVLTFLEKHRMLNIDLITDSTVRRIRTPMVFIGNNALQLRNLSLDVARCMKEDLLAVVAMKELTSWGLAKLIFYGVVRALQSAEGLESFCVNSVDIHTHRSTQTVVLDGEIFKMKSPLKVKALPEILNLILPSQVTP